MRCKHLLGEPVEPAGELSEGLGLAERVLLVGGPRVEGLLIHNLGVVELLEQPLQQS